MDDNIDNFANAEFQPVPTENQQPEVETDIATEADSDNNVSLPLVSSPSGSLAVQFAQNNLRKFNPQSMFQGCTFNAPISITMNSK